MLLPLTAPLPPRPGGGLVLPLRGRCRVRRGDAALCAGARFDPPTGIAHAALSMLAGAWTLQVDGHIRADIFYAGASPRRRALVDLIGAIVFRLVFCGLGGDTMVERAPTRLPGGGRPRDARGHGRAVPARLRHERVRDHLRRGADRGAGAAENARRRSGPARHHDGRESADLLHAPCRSARPCSTCSASRRRRSPPGTSTSASFRMC